MLGNAKISIFWRSESNIQNFQRKEKKEKKSDGKFPIKKFQLADSDRVGRVRGNKLIFNFDQSIQSVFSRKYLFNLLVHVVFFLFLSFVILVIIQITEFH